MNGITVEEALGACGFTGKKRIPLSTLYSRIQTTKERGTYNAIIRRPPNDVGNKVNPLVVHINEDQSNVASPLTIDATLLSLTSSSSSTSTFKTTSTTQRSSRQVSTARVESKRLKVDYKGRFTAAFKEATNLVSRKELPTGESVERLCVRLNSEYNLDGKRRLTKSTLYRATKDGLAGTSPKKKGPEPKITLPFLKTIAAHSQVCQNGEGELRARDMCRLIGAATVGTTYEQAFKVQSVWRKVRSEFPEVLQAGTKISVEDARAQWTTYDNLDQWFDDVKKDLVATGLVEDKAVLDEEGKLVSEVCFKCDSQRRIINMDETHHNLSITGDRGGSRAVTYYNPAFQRGAASRSVKAGRHVTGVYATTSDGEALPPFYIFDSTAQSAENFRVKMDWITGLPTVEGRFGCPSKETYDSFFAVRSRGSMEEQLFNQYIEDVIIPLYPNMNKTAISNETTGKLITRCNLFSLNLDVYINIK